MYKNFYGLSDKPFSIVPNPAYLYKSEKHQDALTYLKYGLMEGTGFILLTGEIGTGKTTLIRYLLNQMETGIDVAVIFNTNITADQLLCQVLDNFEIKPQKDKAANIDLLYQFLIKQFSKGHRVLLIIDEAQNLKNEVLEEVRMLSNLQSDDEILLQIMLVGQPELKNRLMSSELAQLAQRVSVNYHLNGLSKKEIQEYISYRLEKAGGHGDIFSPQAIDMISETSNGIPRIVNQMCDAAMVYGFGYERKNINTEIIIQVIKDKGEIGFNTGKEEEFDNEEFDNNDESLPEPQGNLKDTKKITDVLKELRYNFQEIQLKTDLFSQENEKFREDTAKILQNLITSENDFKNRILKMYASINNNLSDLIKREPTLSKKKNDKTKRGIKNWFSR